MTRAEAIGIAAALEKAARALREPKRPAVNDLIAARMALCNAEFLIESIAGKHRVFEKAARIEHFAFPEALQSCDIREILADLK